MPGIATALWLFVLGAGDVGANPDHHPGGSPAASGGTGMADKPPVGTSVSTMPGMAADNAAPMGGDGMGNMMSTPSSGGCAGAGCGAGAEKMPVYPSLMTLPVLTPEKRAEIDALATEQMREGLERHAKAFQALERALQADDFKAMQQSVGLMREGLGQVGAAIAARRVLSEGRAPRNLALDWFKREMNLASPVTIEESAGLFGVRPFHLFTMALLVVFTLALVVMYFFKMRRTAALFGRIEGGAGPPPPGSSPPIAGTSPPNASGSNRQST